MHKDTRITVSRREDLTEYRRQQMHIRTHPDCEFVPARRVARRVTEDVKDTRITVSRREDLTEYRRQQMHIRTHVWVSANPSRPCGYGRGYGRRR
eukprot:COSAG01_NODE_1683_length_9497_cov_33.408172_6_plen_95_part_00